MKFDESSHTDISRLHFNYRCLCYALGSILSQGKIPNEKAIGYAS